MKCKGAFCESHMYWKEKKKLKSNTSVTSETWQHEGFPLISPPEVTTSWTAIIQRSIPITTNMSQRSFIETAEGGRIRVNREGGQGRRAEMGATDASWSSLWSWERGGFRLQCTLCGPEHSCLSGHIIWLNPVIGAETSGQRPNTEVQQLWSNNTPCQAEKAKPQSLAASPHPPRASCGPQKNL